LTQIGFVRRHDVRPRLGLRETPLEEYTRRFPHAKRGTIILEFLDDLAMTIMEEISLTVLPFLLR
jgi:hypothetical protein